MSRKVKLAYSDDGGDSPSNWRERDLAPIGRRTSSVEFCRLGQSELRLYVIETSADCCVDLIDASVWE